MKGAVAGITVYESVGGLGTSGGAGGGATGDCVDCGWLRDKTALKLKAFKLTVPAKLGRCSCIPDQNGSTVFFLCYDAVNDKWVGNKNFKTCCGCGTIELTLNEAATKLLDIPTMTLTVNKGCTSLAQFTLLLDIGCCGAGTDGQPFAIFIGYGPEACDPDSALPDPPNCNNLFRVKIECYDVKCDDVTTCACSACTECCEGGRASKFFKLPASGFTGACSIYNGTWLLAHSAGCTWTVTGCGGVTVTLEVVEIGVPAVKYFKVTFTASGVPTETYLILADDFNCCGTTVIPRDGAAECPASPTSVTLSAILCGSSCCTDPLQACFLLPSTMIATLSTGCGAYNGATAILTRSGNCWTGLTDASCSPCLRLRITICCAGTWSLTALQPENEDCIFANGAIAVTSFTCGPPFLLVLTADAYSSSHPITLEKCCDGESITLTVVAA